MSISDLKITIDQLKEKVDKLDEKIDLLVKNNIATTQLEAMAAKIINEIQAEVQKCPCNQEIIDAINNKTSNTLVFKTEKEDNQPITGKYSYPNYNVGNEELGSSKNPKSMSWPQDYYKSL